MFIVCIKITNYAITTWGKIYYFYWKSCLQ